MTKKEWLCLLIFLALFLFLYSPQGYPVKVNFEYPAMLNSECNVQEDLELLSGKFLQEQYEPQVMPGCINFCSANDLSHWRVILKMSHTLWLTLSVSIYYTFWCNRIGWGLIVFVDLWNGFMIPTKHVFFSFQLNHPIIFPIPRWLYRWGIRWV